MAYKTTGKYTIILTPKEREALEWFLLKNPCEGGCVWEPHPEGESCKGCEFYELTSTLRKKVFV